MHPCSLGLCHQDWERAYLLAKAQGMVDGARLIKKCPAATQAKTPEDAKRKRVEAAPLYLKGRVERDETLPEVEVGEAGPRKRGAASTLFRLASLRLVAWVAAGHFLMPRAPSTIPRALAST